MLSRTECVGRERDLAELAALLGTSERGAVVVAVFGESGIGKTSLLRQLAATHPGRWATATPWETDLPGGVLAQLLQSDVPADPVDAAACLVDHLTGVPAQLLVIDDADYADIESLQAISTLVRHQREVPVLMVLGATGDIGPCADVCTREIRLTGLSRDDVAELARRRGTALHPTTADRLTRHTRGNPRDVLALLEETPAAVWTRPDAELPAPAHVLAAVRERLAGCDAPGQALVQAFAVLGPHATLSEATELAAVAEPLPALDAAVRSGLLDATTPFAPTLTDPLTRTALAQLMGIAATTEAHRRAASIVTDPIRRLQHRVAASPFPDPDLADEVDALAWARGRDGAWAQAAELFRDASRLTPDPLTRDERLTLAVDALVAAGDCGAAAAMVPTVESMRETPLRNAVLGYLALLRGRAAEADVRLRRAWDIVNVKRNPATAALIAQRHVLHHLMRCRGDELVLWADRAAELADQDSPAAIESAAIRGLGLAAAGHPISATQAYEQLTARLRHGAQAQRVTMGRGWLQLIRDDVDGARASLESAVATANLGGSTRITLWANAWLARAQFVTGEWDDALATVAAGRVAAQQSGITVVTPLLEWTAANVHALRGDWTEAERAVQAADAVTHDYAMMRIPVVLARAAIAEAEADYARVRETLTPLVRMADGTSLTEPGHWPWPDVLANALVVDGHLTEADAFLRPHEQRARARGHRSAMARLGYARGRLLGAQGDVAAARASFDESLRLLEGLPLRYDLARVNFAYGQTLRRAGKRRDADAVISTARDLYLSLGAHTYVARCDRELKAGGLHQQRGSRDSVQLTPQEEAVTALVAQGLSNREVAAELYVSTKTVQYHLTRVYAKLGVRSRSELAAVRR
ncbi:LuxR C-terminal-related transcriptional regulator [Mycobacterium sp. ACS4331]|uniref:helix-turn-helix transcriptional regulator n=1 Tax=Mycobacterium sp. ACS4331 TaxID=1834121 RepID=UPI000A92E7EE|nr:LuxR C-terminal-related transcriptional regulator [Mycobacterium sp. ACS4331]